MRKVILGVSALLIGAGVYASTFTPTASYDISARYYGQAEEGVVGTNNGNKGARIQHLIKAKFTEKNTLEIRVRDHQDLNASGAERQRRDDTETRVRLTHDFGKIGNTDIGQVGRIQYRKRGTDKHVEYGHLLQFADYGFHNDYVRTLDLTVMPSYRYTWKNNDDHVNTLGLDVYTFHSLPKGVDLAVNLYTRRDEGTNNDGTYAYDVEAYLYKTLKTFDYKDVNYAIKVEAGLDCYSSVAKKEISDLSVKDGSYSLYVYPNVGFTKAIDKNATIYGHAGAEYRNFSNTSYKSADNWRLQPTCTVGAKLTF